mmetsp:Transcript_8814/g.18301  ORF Transcript_8814/g.18301 Transcript_8814/m.18301 type:complete len:215 (-) Transcript_8814:170-814(-)
MRLLTSLKIFLLSVAAVGAFSPVAKIQRGNLAHRTALSSVEPSKHAGDRGSAKMPNRGEFLAVLGSFVTGAVMSSVEPANAEVMPNPSSSIFLSDEIKTIDFSMPTYDSINTLKQDDKALGVEDLPETRSAPKSKPKKKSEGSSGGGGLGSVLPSMNKSGPSAKKPKPPKAKKEVEKSKKAAKPEPKAEFETMDMALPSYSENAAAPERSIFAL